MKLHIFKYGILLFMSMHSWMSSAQMSGGLGPLRGETSSTNTNSTFETIQPSAPVINKNPNNPLSSPQRKSLLEDQNKLTYSARVKKYISEAGTKFKIIEATISKPVNSPSIRNALQAQYIEETQTWWRLPENRINMIFHNSTNKSIVGFILKIKEGKCDSDTPERYQSLKFSSNVNSNTTQLVNFVMTPYLPAGSSCIDIVDVIY